MSKKKNTPKKLQGISSKRNHRSLQESKLERRRFALPMAEQEKILQEYRDKGLAFGRASHTGLINDNQRTQKKEKDMEQNGLTLPESNCKFLSFAVDWNDRTTIEYVLMDLPGGKEVAVGRIDVLIDPNNGERSFQAYGQDGKELFGRRTSLYWLKKDFIRREDDLYRIAVENSKRPTLGGSHEALTAELQAVHTNAPSKPIPSPYSKELKRDNDIKRINKSQERNKGKSRGR